MKTRANIKADDPRQLAGKSAKFYQPEKMEHGGAGEINAADRLTALSVRRSGARRHKSRLGGYAGFKHLK